jgi:hypothetical protein
MAMEVLHHWGALVLLDPVDDEVGNVFDPETAVMLDGKCMRSRSGLPSRQNSLKVKAVHQYCAVWIARSFLRYMMRCELCLSLSPDIIVSVRRWHYVRSQSNLCFAGHTASHQSISEIDLIPCPMFLMLKRSSSVLSDIGRSAIIGFLVSVAEMRILCGILLSVHVSHDS